MLQIKIPFEGLYNSYLDSVIDDYIVSLFDPEGTGDPSLIPDKWHNHFTYTDKMLKAIGTYHIDCINSVIGHDIELRFDTLESPKYYNYETDKIYAFISRSDIKKLWRNTKPEILKQVIESRHSSGSGFISFYSNDIESATWQKSPLEYDGIQLETLLIAYLLSDGGADISTDSMESLESYGILSPYDLYEDLNGSGELDFIVFENMPQECINMVNAYYKMKESR